MRGGRDLEGRALSSLFLVLVWRRFISLHLRGKYGRVCGSFFLRPTLAECLRGSAGPTEAGETAFAVSCFEPDTSKVML